VNPLKKLLGQTAVYGLSSIVGRLLNYLLVPLYTRYFSTAEYGEVTLLYAYVAFILVLLTYGMETAFFRFSQSHPNKSTVYSTSLISLSLSSLLFVGMMLYYSQAIAEALSFSANPEYVEYFALILGLDTLSAITFAKLREQNRAVRFATIRLLNIFINISLNLFFIVYCPLAISNNYVGVEFIQRIYLEHIGIGYIFISNLVASALTLLFFVPEMIKSTWRFDTALWRKMMIYALPLMFAGLAGITNETIDRILLKHLLPSEVSASEIGIYSAFYKLSIIMTLFVQTFRFAAEPFFFAQEKEANAKAVYALVMKYFMIVTAFIFLLVTIYYDLFKQFLGSEFHDERGLIIVPILLLANLFLGIYYNLSVWYKLTEKTVFGAYMSLMGALITLFLNLYLIPILGFVGSAWATLCCYAIMALCSYLLGQKYYPISYPIGRIGVYLLAMLGLFFLSKYYSLGLWYNSLYLVLFVALSLVLESSTKKLISKP